MSDTIEPLQPAAEGSVRLSDGEAPPEPKEPEAWQAAVFPLEVLPPGLACYCREAAEALAAPMDYVGLAIITVSGAAIGNSRVLCLKESTWNEGGRIYAACVGDPASGKTPAIETVNRPYQAYQDKSLATFRKEWSTYEQGRDKIDRLMQKNRCMAKDDRQDVEDLPDKPPKPKRFLTTDATAESLALLMQDNPDGLLIFQDEGVGLIRGMNQYKGGHGSDRQFYLSCWSGRSIVVDRKAQAGMAISVPRPFLSVICGIQPDMLGELTDHKGRNDGFVDRFLFVYPKATFGADWSEATVSLQAHEAWASALRWLRSLEMPNDDGGEAVTEPTVIQFSAEAKQRWVDWWNGHAAEMRSEALAAYLLGPWAKLRTYAARLAFILHFLWLAEIDAEECEVAAETVARAIKLVDYFKSHLKLVHSRLHHSAEDIRSFDVLDWMRRRGGECTARDLLRAKKAPTASKAKEILHDLEERELGHIELRIARNNRTVEHFVLNAA